MNKDMNQEQMEIQNNMSIESNTDNIKNNIYFNNVLTKKITIKSKYLNEKIDEYISEFIKNKVEGICIDEGYVKPESVKVLKRSVGMLLNSKFTGDITFTVAYTAIICNPVIGNIIDCKVKFINKSGILGNNGPITIIVGKQLYKNEDFEHITVNDNIKVEVVAKKFSLNDKEIKIVAKLWYENGRDNIELMENKKSQKKDELISSDLTPILYENEYEDNENENFSINSDENELEENMSMIDDDILMSDDDDFDDNDDNDDNDDKKDKKDKIKVENPDGIQDENNLDIEDINIDDSDISEDDDEEEGDSVVDYDD
jgi:DNA-directed RNA polymerase subunit E'/Rpb7